MTTKLGFATIVRVKDIMTRQVFALGASDSLAQAAELLGAEGVTGAPVLENGRVVGIVSKSDLVGREPSVPVREAMTKVLYALHPDDPALLAVKLMVAQHLHRVVVMDGHGALVGIVTPLDVCRALLDNKPIAFNSAAELDVKFVPTGSA